MANELCASGFVDTLINGQYELMYVDHWTNGNYWIYKDSFFWMISSSPTTYELPYLVAIKEYIAGSWANGDYYSVGDIIDGNYTLGDKVGQVSSGTC
jgi:hypothetical protein